MGNWLVEIEASKKDWLNDSKRGGERYCEKILKSFRENLDKTLEESLGRKKPKKKKKTKIVGKWNPVIYNMKVKERKIYEELEHAEENKKLELEKLYKSQKREIQKLVRRNKKEEYQKVIKEIEDLKSKDPKDYWKKIQELNPILRKKETTPDVMRNKEGKLVGGKEALEIWKQGFKNLGTANINSEEDKKNTVQVIDEETEEFLNKEFSLNEVTEEIKKLKRGKATGEDDYMNEIFKYGGTKIQEATWKLCNEIWMHDERFPLEWARGQIFPIFKGGPEDYKHDPMKYRGITLLSVLGKLYTAIIKERLTRWCEMKEIIVEEQGGFRRERSTVDQIFILLEIITCRRPDPTYCCFIDIQKAYDKVWRDAIWKKLDEYGIKGRIWRVIKNIYERVESCVLVGNEKTEYFEIDLGVRQGCILSPILFSLFINGLGEELRKKNIGAKIGNLQIPILMFADDIVLIGNTKEELLELMKITYEYSIKWKFAFNYDKCAVIVFEQKHLRKIKLGKDCKEGKCYCNKHWKLGNTLINEVLYYKYLGIEISKNLTMKAFKLRIKNKAKENMLKAFGMGMSSGHLSIKAGINLYNALVRSILDYGSEIWGYDKWEDGEKIQRAFGRRLLRCSSKTTNEAVLGELGWWRLATVRDYKKLCFWLKIQLMKPTRLVKKMYEESKKKYLENNQNNWTQGIHKLLITYESGKTMG